MGVLDVSLLLYIPYPGLYNKTHIQSVYNVIRRKLKPIEIVIMKLFQQMSHNSTFFLKIYLYFIYIYIYII